MTRIGVASSLLCVLCCIGFSLAFVFEDCGSEVAKFSEATLSACDLSEDRCTIVRGTDVIGSIKFIPNQDISSIEARVFGVFMDIPVSMPLKKPNVCEDPDSGITCPLKKDQEVEYKATIFVEKNVPALSLDVMWEFINENNEKIVCITAPVKIQ